MSPNTIKSISIRFRHWVLTLCSEKYIAQDEQFLIDMFVDSRKQTQQTFLWKADKGVSKHKKEKWLRKLVSKMWRYCPG